MTLLMEPPAPQQPALAQQQLQQQQQQQQAQQQLQQSIIRPMPGPQQQLQLQGNQTTATVPKAGSASTAQQEMVPMAIPVVVGPPCTPVRMDACDSVVLSSGTNSRSPRRNKLPMTPQELSVMQQLQPGVQAALVQAAPS